MLGFILYVIYISLNLYSKPMKVDNKYLRFAVEEAQAQKYEVACVG